MFDLPPERLNERLDEAITEAQEFIDGLQDPIADAIKASKALTESLEELKEFYEFDEHPIEVIQDLIQRIRLL